MRFFALIASFALLATGCNQGPFASNPLGNANAQANAAALQQQQQQAVALAAKDRANQLDVNNKDLNVQLAQSQQQNQVLQKQVTLLNERLSETAGKLQQLQVAAEDSQQRLQGLQASTQRRGGAVITANNSLKQSLKVIQAPGFDIRLDGDVVRIEMPADQIFQKGTYQLLPTAPAYLDQAAQLVTQNYPRQLIAIEAHTDSSTPSAALGLTSNHQLSASQAMIVFDHFSRRSRMPSQQLFTVAQGGNHPIASNATAAGAAKNRRIEVVVYPETLGER